MTSHSETDLRRFAREHERKSLRLGRRWRKARSLLHEAEQKLHSLPESLRPNDLIERIRLHLNQGEQQ